MINLIIVLLLLTGCGSGESGAPVIDSKDIAPGDILVHTEFANIPAGVGVANQRRINAVVNSPYSTLVAIDPVRMPAISQSDELIINTTFMNNTPGRLLDLQFGVDLEHTAHMTRENWECWRCFDTLDGGYNCQGLWMVEGGYFYNTTTPTLPACQGDPPGSPAICIDTFPPNIDCRQEPYYRIDNRAAGSGCSEFYGGHLDLGPGQSVMVQATTQGSIDIRRDHLARAFVRTIEGRIVAVEYYIFDVGP